ncbi:hypothetical protein, partial [Herbinix luporum]|uniref:hypothetical protein n=1 Tax=Herbinix luporum TaxID=1679721 RepID=UPI0023EFD9D2
MYKKSICSSNHWDKSLDFCGTTRFGAAAPTYSMYIYTCSLDNGWRYRQVLLVSIADFLPA